MQGASLSALIPTMMIDVATIVIAAAGVVASSLIATVGFLLARTLSLIDKNQEALYEHIMATRSDIESVKIDMARLWAEHKTHHRT